MHLPAPFPRSALAIPIVLAILHPWRQVIEIPRETGCRGCSIAVRQVAVLGEEDGPGMIESESTTGVADSRGRIFLYAAYSPPVKAYDAGGRYVATLGAEGQGPGEFRGVGAVRVSAGDTVHVFDGDNLRTSVFSPALRLARTTRLEIPPQTEAAALGGDRVVLGVPLRSPSRAGLPLHLLDGGRVVRSFGSTSGAFRPDIPYFDERAIAPAGPGRVWVVHKNRYQVELWSTDGRKLRELRRSVAWFPPHVAERPVSPDRPPPTTIQQVAVDGAGRLWIKILVPDRDWRRAVRAGGPHGYTVRDRAGYYDTLIEVIDPRRGRVLASRRFPELVQLLGHDRIGAVVTGADDIPRFVVWRAQLVSPPSRRSR